MNTSTQIKQYKQLSNMNYRELAQALGVSIATVENWASGKHRPNEANQKKLDKMMQTKTAEIKPVELANGDFAIDSRLVADMVKKRHDHLIRDINNYISAFSLTPNLGAGYFTKNTYTDKRGQKRPCYLVTKKGCELIAHKMTGQKGVLFTARYIDIFHEMEQQLQQKQKAVEYRPAPVASYTPRELDCAYIDKLVDEVKRETNVRDKYLKLEEITLIAQRMEQVRGNGGR